METNNSSKIYFAYEKLFHFALFLGAAAYQLHGQSNGKNNAEFGVPAGFNPIGGI